MKQIQFLPWVGRDYVRGINGKHVMVLGESHYCANNEEAVPGITQDVISGYIDSSNDFEGWMNTYTKFIRAYIFLKYFINKQTCLLFNSFRTNNKVHILSNIFFHIFAYT